MRGELEKNLLSLEKPLKFASKDNFSNLDRMADLGGTVRNSCTKVLTSAPPAEIKTQITALRDSFSDFEKLGRREKRKKISSALRIVHKAISFSEENARENVSPEKRTRAQVPEKKPYPGADASSPSVTRLRGVGSRVGRLLAKKSIHTVYDLLFYSPRKYDDRRKIVRISEAVPEEFCTVRGTVASVGDIRNRKRKFFQVVIYDGTGRLRLTWFNYNPSYLRGVFRKGMSFIIHGKVSLAPGG